jgi:hypothetical protein
MFGQKGARISAEDLVNLTDFGDPGSRRHTPLSFSREAFLAIRARRAIVGDDSYCTMIALVPLDLKNRTKVIDDGGDIAPATGDIYGIADIPVGGPKARSCAGRHPVGALHTQKSPEPDLKSGYMNWLARRHICCSRAQ